MIKKRILVIDDDSAVGTVIKDMLEFEKYEISFETSSEQGIRAAQQYSPDAIILDLSMPGLDGFEVYSLLKKDVRTKSIPIIVITGYTDKETVFRLRSLGLTGVFYKPLNFGQLRKRLKFLLGSANLDTSLCPKCGRKMEEGWQYCPFDGTKKNRMEKTE